MSAPATPGMGEMRNLLHEMLNMTGHLIIEDWLTEVEGPYKELSQFFLGANDESRLEPLTKFSHIAFREEVIKMVNLLSQPQPGLMSWMLALVDVYREMSRFFPNVILPGGTESKYVIP